MFSAILPGSSETFERASPGPISWSNSIRFTEYIIPHDLEYTNNLINLSLEDHLVHTYHKKKVIHLVYRPVLPVQYLNAPESAVLCKKFTLKILNTVHSLHYSSLYPMDKFSLWCEKCVQNLPNYVCTQMHYLYLLYSWNELEFTVHCNLMFC